jgi:hypothetical protein
MGIGFAHNAVVLSTAGIETLSTLDQLALDPILFPMVSKAGPTPMRHPWIAPCNSFGPGGCQLGGAGEGPNSPGSATTFRPARFAPAILLGAALGYAVTR